MEDLRTLTCENWEATDEEIEKAVEKIDTDLTLYGKKLFDIEIIHNKVLERCRCISVKSKPKKQDGGTRNKKNPTNLHENDQNCDKDVSKVEDPENEFPKWLLELDYTIKTHYENDVKVKNTYAINNSIITGMVQNNEGPEDLKVAKNGFMDARKKQKVKKKVKKKNGVKKKTESMESKDEKKVICIYWKKSNKESKGLPDTDCRQEIRSPQEMMQHIQEEHPWLKWSI